MKKFTEKELAQHSGKSGTKPYIAFSRKVYDVSNSFHWKNGKHQVLHQAGEDLTEAIREAPHGGDLLERVPIIGVILKSE